MDREWIERERGIRHHVNPLRDSFARHISLNSSSSTCPFFPMSKSSVEFSTGKDSNHPYKVRHPLAHDGTSSREKRTMFNSLFRLLPSFFYLILWIESALDRKHHTFFFLTWLLATDAAGPLIGPSSRWRRQFREPALTGGGGGGLV